MWLVGVVIRRYIDILIIIINFPYSTCIRSFFGSSILTSLFIFKCFFGLYIYTTVCTNTHQAATLRGGLLHAHNHTRWSAEACWVFPCHIGVVPNPFNFTPNVIIVLPHWRPNLSHSCLFLKGLGTKLSSCNRNMDDELNGCRGLHYVGINFSSDPQSCITVVVVVGKWLADVLGIKRRLTTPYHPQVNELNCCFYQLL